MSVTLYIEGGGEGKAQASQFRQAWRAFFETAGRYGNLPKVVRGGSRNETYGRFTTAAARGGEERAPILLVDSEGPVASGLSVWRYLKDRDDWVRPREVQDDSAFLMVQVMETWFLADRAALRRYFGERFLAKAIPLWPELERVPKAGVLNALKRATAKCSNPYAKGGVSFELLSTIDAQVVERECPHARHLLVRLRGSTGKPRDAAAS